ncbi:hypothetical protein Tco_0057192 [Tanacetum coccineum]
MEESPCRQFRGERHMGMLTMGQGTLLQIRVLTNKGLQVKQGWLSVTTVKRKVILLDNVPNQRPKNLTWFKEKMLLTEALESGSYLDPEQLAFLADNGDTVIPSQAS